MKYESEEADLGITIGCVFLSACRGGCGRATQMSRKKRRDRSRLLLIGHTNLALEFHVN